VSDHIDQNTLESIILNPRLTLPVRPASTKRKRGEQAGGGQAESVSAEDFARITAHLAECSLCAEQWRKLKDVYGIVEEDLEHPPTQRDQELARGLLESKRIALSERGLELRPREDSLRETLESYAEVIEPYRRGVIQRFVRYARLYPLRTASATAFAAAAVILSLLLTRTPKDTNATHAIVKDYVLSVFNKEGAVLWKKQLPGVPDGDTWKSWEDYGRRFVVVDDIDGEGMNIVLIAGGIETAPTASDSLYCFEGDGELRWVIDPGTSIPFGKMQWASGADWAFRSSLIVRDRIHNKPLLFAIASSKAFFPSKLVEIDPKRGHVLQTYWHAGSVGCQLVYDVDGDGNDEIIIGGHNSSYNQAFMSVLDPSAVDGCGPATDNYLPTSVRRATEKYYLLFPISELGRVAGRDPYNSVHVLRGSKNQSFILHTRESSDPYQGTLVYNIVPTMRVGSVVDGNDFTVSYNRLVKEGKLHHKLDKAYLESLARAVQYWDGEKFVNTPVMNRLYNPVSPLP
jgi:hypothetical protein